MPTTKTGITKNGDPNGEIVSITNLFSRSTYIRAEDQQDSTIDIKKVNANDPNKTLAGAKFRLYKLDSSENKLYYKIDNNTVSWTKIESEATIATSKYDGLLDTRFAHLTKGTYYLEETQAPIGFTGLSGPVKIELDITATNKLTATFHEEDSGAGLGKKLMKQAAFTSSPSP